MGYIYAISNKSMPWILKIGMTERRIEERLKEANGTFTLIPFVVEISKKVLNCKEKEKCIHQILQSKRVNPKKEFFEVMIEEIKLLNWKKSKVIELNIENTFESCFNNLLIF